MHTTTTATTIHTPRPATITPSSAGVLHHFGPAHTLRADTAGIDVVRRADRDNGVVTLTGSGYYAAAHLTPTQLRELAARLIDAAHDIDTTPAPPIDWKA